MIQQANFNEPKTGNGKKSDILSDNTGMSGIGGPVDRWGWKSLLVFMMLSPMASFEQDGRIGGHQRQSVALHREKSPRVPPVDCCDPSTDLGRKETRTGLLYLPDSRSVERADREMIRNHAEMGDKVLLPSLEIPQVEDADMDMDLMFRMSNANWTTLVETADVEMDIRFRIEHILPAWEPVFLDSDKEMNDRFQQDQQQA